MLLIQFEYTNIKSETDGLLDCIRMMTHCDLLILPKVLSIMKDNEQLLIQCYEEVAYLDSMIAVANYRCYLKNQDGYCIPTLVSGGRKHLNIDELYYPLIQDAVPNSFEASQSILITGSNATGKSTFLRAAGVAAVMAQSIYTVCAKSYHASLFYVMSSMCIRDNVFKGDSCFLKEIKTLKYIIDMTKEKSNVFCCLDEVLKGTNTKERVSAATEILMDLDYRQTLCLVATHDMELTDSLEGIYKNYHFTEQVLEDSITFDYKLYKGKSTSCNAIELLRIIGYSDEIVTRAKTRVQLY